MAKHNRLTSALLCILALLFLLPAVVWADSSAPQESTLHILYQDSGTPLEGAQFDLFYVGAVDEYGAVSAAPDFAGFEVALDGTDAEDWRVLASTLEGYVAVSDLLPFAGALTDADGKVTFAGLPAGLYFVRGHRLTLEDVSYDTDPFIVRLPHYDEAVGAYVDEVTVRPKNYIPDGNPINRRVLKVWDDNQNADGKRPTEVVVNLLCNGEIYDTVTLSEANNWRYSWEGLNGYQQWSVVEEGPANYKVEITREGITFVVRNTYVAPPPPPPPTLPQTGQLWWPVPILAVAGLFLMAAGLLRRRGSDYEA